MSAANHDEDSVNCIKHKAVRARYSMPTTGACPRKNSDILTWPLTKPTFEQRDINANEGQVKMSGFVVTQQQRKVQQHRLEAKRQEFISEHGPELLALRCW